MILGLTDTLIELWLLNCLLAYSAYVVLNGGSFSFAYVAFIAIGAYTAAIVIVKEGGSTVTAVLIAPVLCAVIALLLARPLERLSGVYLAIVSISFVGLIQVLLINLESLTGGALGMAGIPLIVEMWWLGIAVVVVALVVRQIERSNLGRAIRMTRVDPLVAGAMGVNVRRVRLWLFTGSAALAGVAGVIRAHYFGFVTPSEYGFNLVVLLLAMVIIGGVGSWVGPLIGAFIFTMLPEWLRSFGDWRDVVTGVLLLLIIIVSREGVAGTIRLQWHHQRRRLQGKKPLAAEFEESVEDEPEGALAGPRV
jgi:branched-chain amino acid transport system permease protein